MGAWAYKIINDLKLNHGYVVEIGSERGEGSTQSLYNYCQNNKLPFLTVDWDKEIFENAREMVGSSAYNMTGEDFLGDIFPNLPEPTISFLYLDNFDWTWSDIKKEPWLKAQKERYKLSGIIMNNKNSQQVHLQQSWMADRFIDSGGIVLFDDTWRISKNKYGGKGGTAVPYLLSSGYVIYNKLENKKEDKEGFVCLIKK